MAYPSSHGKLVAELTATQDLSHLALGFLPPHHVTLLWGLLIPSLMPGGGSILEEPGTAEADYFFPPSSAFLISVQLRTNCIESLPKVQVILNAS